MSTFEALSLIVACIAMLVSLAVWAGQRRLQQEANDLQRTMASLAQQQSALLRKQELEPAFGALWQSLGPKVEDGVSSMRDWLQRCKEALGTGQYDYVPPIPELLQTDFSSLDWRYSPQTLNLLQELSNACRRTAPLATEYNKTKLVGTEHFWLAEKLRVIGFDEGREQYEPFGGSEAYVKFLDQLLLKCGLSRADSPLSLAQSPIFKQNLDNLGTQLTRSSEEINRLLDALHPILKDLNARFKARTEA